MLCVLVSDQALQGDHDLVEAYLDRVLKTKTTPP